MIERIYSKSDFEPIINSEGVMDGESGEKVEPSNPSSTFRV